MVEKKETLEKEEAKNQRNPRNKKAKNPALIHALGMKDYTILFFSILFIQAPSTIFLIYRY